jgi:hypothetical protein
MNRTNYIFIDFENVQEIDLERIANKPVQVTLILGERHKSLPLKLVRLIPKVSDADSVSGNCVEWKERVGFRSRLRGWPCFGKRSQR